MVLDIIAEVDYDIWKGFDPKLSEDPEYAEEALNRLIDMAEKHINKASKKKQ